MLNRSTCVSQHLGYFRVNEFKNSLNNCPLGQEKSWIVALSDRSILKNKIKKKNKTKQNKQTNKQTKMKKNQKSTKLDIF